MKFSLFQFWAILITINLLCLIASAQSMNERIDERVQASLTGTSSGVSCSWQYGGAINKRDIRKKKITLPIFKDFYCSKDAGSEVLCYSEEFKGSLKRK